MGVLRLCWDKQVIDYALSDYIMHVSTILLTLNAHGSHWLLVLCRTPHACLYRLSWCAASSD